MKKFLSLVAVMALVAMVSSTVFAAPYSTQKARAIFTASAVEFTVNLHHWGGSGSYASQPAATAINFDAADVTLGTVNVSSSVSKDYALIHSNLNQQPANTVVYVYTNNKSTATTNTFVAVSSGTSTGFNGLVRKGQSSTYVDGDYAPIITKCVTVSSANINFNTAAGPKAATFLNNDQYEGDRWLADKSTAGFVNSENIIGKGGVGGGIYIGNHNPATNPNWYSAEDVVMFFKANFNSVNGGDEYGTDTITFNTVVE